MQTQNASSVYPFSADNGGGSGIARAGADKYPNPFCDIASEYLPRDINTMFEYCEYLYLTMGTYRSAARRVVRYFLTELDLDGESDSERERYQDFLDDDMHLLAQLADIGDDYMTYGNVFISLYFPFDRFLICPECRTLFHIDTIKYKFSMKEGSFKGDCPNPKCKAHDVTFTREDRRSPNKERVKLIRWNPKQIRLRVHPVSGYCEYYMELDPQFVKKLEEGNPFYLNQTPWSMIESCRQVQNQKQRPLFKFRKDSIYHLKEASLAGIEIKGWAIPPIIPNFRLAYYIQILRRYDEAIALDFIVPFRVLFPQGQKGPQGQDPLSTMNMGSFIGHMNNMVKNKRKGITDIQVSPFPIGYEMLGGEGKELAPKENIAQALDELLNAVGFPAELYRGSLSIQAFPVALRLFEKTWGAMVDGFNDLISWVMLRLNKHFMWGDVTGKLRSVTLADDIERKALALQAAAGMDISKGTAYRPLGIDYLEEQRRVTEEQEQVMKLQQEAMERQQAAEMGAGAEGGAEGGPGGQPGATPGDVYEQGKQMAEQLLLQTPENMRRGELIKIKHSNPTLHAIVIQEMDNMRQEMSRQGQAMVMDQVKQAEASKLPSTTTISLLIADQIMDYNRGDLRKIAMDIKRKIPHAREAFSFVWRRMIGVE